MKVLMLLTIAVVCLTLASGVNSYANVVDITAAEAKAMIDENSDLTVIDVSPLWGDSHIPGAINLFVGDGQLDAAIPSLDSIKPYLVYCHTDAASNQAADKLVESGFTTVYRLYGNFGAWQSAEFETATPAYMDISTAEALTLVENNSRLIVVDVSPVYTNGHLPGAISLSLGDGTLDKAIMYLDPNAEYLVYCHTDEASMSGAQTLVNAGFSRVKRLAGNYSAWVDSGYSTETSSDTYSDLEAGDASEFLSTTPNAIVIDVSPHYAENHIPGALHYLYNEGELHAGIPQLSKSARILVYCHVDAVSIGAAQTLSDAGFMNVYRLAGNYSSWVNGGFTVETPAYSDLSASAAKELLDSSSPPVVIDVSPVYRSGHIPGAVGYSLVDDVISLVSNHLVPNGDYLVYCHSDAASIAGAQTLIDAGFTRVKRLEGNYSAWTTAGYEVVVSPPDYRDISPLAAQKLIEGTAEISIIDVSPLYDQGHIPGAVNYPFGTGDFAAKIPDFEKTGTYLIYCHGDIPSQGAAEALYEAGFESVYRLYGNYSAWVDAGLEISKQTAVDNISPNAFRLSGAYPNPFNPTTTIRFEIPSDSVTKLAVYDTLGRKVADILDEHVGAGSHSIQWTGMDSSGNTLGSGIFIVKLTAAGLTATSKITLIR